MAFLGMKTHDDFWFVGGLVLAAVLGTVAGNFLSIPFLIVCSMALFFVWFAPVGYCCMGRPGLFAVWLVLAIPIMVFMTWITVIVSMWGFFR